jgi:hypothetical protein
MSVFGGVRWMLFAEALIYFENFLRTWPIGLIKNAAIPSFAGVRNL